MEIEFDPAKDAANTIKHGISLRTADLFDMGAALIEYDDRHDYKEQRMIAIGPIGDRLHVLVYTLRGSTVRVISLRKANRKEATRYVEQA
jgi:uncharacterized DUF497 family protein